MLEENKMELEQLHRRCEAFESLEQEMRARIKELETKLDMVRDENACLIGGGSEHCSLSVSTLPLIY